MRRARHYHFYVIGILPSRERIGLQDTAALPFSGTAFRDDAGVSRSYDGHFRAILGLRPAKYERRNISALFERSPAVYSRVCVRDAGQVAITPSR